MPDMGVSHNYIYKSVNGYPRDAFISLWQFKINLNVSYRKVRYKHHEEGI